MHRFPLICGAILGGLSVACGAFGAHWLQGAVTRWNLPPVEAARALDVWDVAVRYQMYHALALLAVGLLATRPNAPTSLTWATWLFLFGVVVFSGLLYALVLSGVKVLGAIVPIGGTALIVGWMVLAHAAWRLR